MGAEQQSPPPGPASPPRRPRRRRRAAAVLLVAVLAAGGVLAVRRAWPRPGPQPPEMPLMENEPAVAATVAAARDWVLREPRSAEAWGSLGQVFLANELDDEAAVCCAEAERLDPTNPRWPYYRAGVVLNRGDREQALPLLRQAIARAEAAREPALPARLFLAESLLALDRPEEARAEYELVGAAEPDNPRVLLGLGRLAMLREDWEAARQALTRCLASPQARQKARLHLAGVALAQGDAAAATRYREQARRLPADADWPDPYIAEYLRYAAKKRARYKLAETLEAAGRTPEAIPVLQSLAADYPDDYLPQLTLAKYLGQLGRYDLAARAVERARELAPDLVQVRYYQGLITFARAEQGWRGGEARAEAAAGFAEAVRLTDQALALKPDYGFAHMTRGLALKYLGRAEDSRAALAEAVRCNPEVGELHYHLGLALADASLADAGLADPRLAEEARRQLALAVELGPEDAPWCRAARERLAGLPPLP